MIRWNFFYKNSKYNQWKRVIKSYKFKWTHLTLVFIPMNQNQIVHIINNPDNQNQILKKEEW